MRPREIPNCFCCIFRCNFYLIYSVSCDVERRLPENASGRTCRPKAAVRFAKTPVFRRDRRRIAGRSILDCSLDRLPFLYGT